MVLARFQRTIQDLLGSAVDGASVEVLHETPGAPLANLFSDRDGTVSIGNPVTADSEGFASFYVADGVYRITATSGALSRTWRYVGISLSQERSSPVAGISWLYDSATADSDPGSGMFRFNNATPGSATAIYIDDLDSLGVDQSSWLAQLATFGDTSNRGNITLRSADGAVLLVARVTGTPSDSSGYWNVPITVLAASAVADFVAGATFGFLFSTAGADGADGSNGADGADGLFAGTETQVTARSGDLVPLQDVSDSNDPKRATAQSMAETARVEVELMSFGVSEDVTTGDGAGDVFFRVPVWMNGYNITAVAAAHVTAGTSATSPVTDTSIQIRNVTQAADILSTPLTIDASETDSSTAATAAAINGAQDDLTTGDLIRIDVDAVPESTPPQGLIVSMTAERPTS